MELTVANLSGLVRLTFARPREAAQVADEHAATPQRRSARATARLSKTCVQQCAAP